MARELGDVLHYFMPEAGAGERPQPRFVPSHSPSASSAPRPVVWIPLGERDLLRATFAWNLAVELGRLGAGATLLAPARCPRPAVWPEPGPGPVGAELVLTPAAELPSAAHQALEVAGARSVADTHPIVLGCVPPTWLHRTALESAGVERVLLFSSPDTVEMIETYALAKHVMTCVPDCSVGVTVYGVTNARLAEATFSRLAETAERHVGRAFESYGMLLDELQIYRSIVERRPIGVAQPQSPAARALRDVARLLLADVQAVARA